jgi:hypothetical protein
MHSLQLLSYRPAPRPSAAITISRVGYDSHVPIWIGAAIVSLAALISLSPATGHQLAPWSVRVQSIASPARGVSAQPQLSTSSRGVLLSWIERSGETATLRFAERTAGGWTPATAVASGTDWFVNWADVPSVLRMSDGTLAAHWLQKSGSDTYAYDVRLSYSKDDGKTWAPSFLPHHDGTRAEHGFASLVEMPGAGLGVLWLDGRATKAGHDGQGGGDMSIRFAAYDTQWKQIADTAVDTRVCECCPTSAVVTADGPIAAFRDRTAEEIRDIGIARYQNGAWTRAKAAHADNWRIEACPVNGPMLAARGRHVAIAWFTAKGDEGHTFVAFSHDSGRTFADPIRLDDGGALGRVGLVLLPDGAAVATWIEFANQRAEFRMRRIDLSGATSAPITIAGLEGDRTSGYPRVAVRGDELVFAWTASAGGALQVRTANALLSENATKTP